MGIVSPLVLRDLRVPRGGIFFANFNGSQKSVIDGSWTQGRIGPRRRRCPVQWGCTANCRSSHMSGGSRRKKKRKGNASSNLASDTRHQSNGGGPQQKSGPIPLCKYTSSDLPASSLPPSLPKYLLPSHPIPSLSFFSSSYFPTKVGGSSFRTNNKSRLASTYRRRRGTLLGVCTHNFC